MAFPIWIRNVPELRELKDHERHEPEPLTAREMAQWERRSGDCVARVVVVLADGRPVELVLPADRRIQLDRVRGLLGAQEVHLASEEETEEFFRSCELGGIPPARNWGGAEVLMDASMRVDGYLLLQASTHGDAIRIRFKDWYRQVQPQVGEFCEPATAIDI